MKRHHKFSGLNTAPSSTSMAVIAAPSPTSASPHLRRPKSPTYTPRKSLSILAMAPKKKVNKYDGGWQKKWYGQGLFLEGSEEIEVDVFKKLEKRKVLSNVEKAGLLSKAEGLGFTLSSIEKLGVLSKAEEFGLLSLLERAAGFSPAALASAALPLFVAAIAAIVLIPDDSPALLTVQALLAGSFVIGATGLFVGSVVLDGLQDAD
ncbi:hypothetical protein V2J09_019483 [Rumex salicifolius]